MFTGSLFVNNLYLNIMIIHYMDEATVVAQKSRKQVLVGKFWLTDNGYNMYQGRIGNKKRSGEKLINVFKSFEGHPDDKVFLKVNKYKNNTRDPDLLLYIENVIAKIN